MKQLPYLARCLRIPELPLRLLSLAALLWVLGVPVRAADVVVNPAQTFQTIEGWGHGGGILGGTAWPYNLLGPAVADPVNYQYLDYLLHHSSGSPGPKRNT